MTESKMLFLFAYLHLYIYHRRIIINNFKISERTKTRSKGGPIYFSITNDVDRLSAIERNGRLSRVRDDRIRFRLFAHTPSKAWQSFTLNRTLREKEVGQALLITLKVKAALYRRELFLRPPSCCLRFRRARFERLGYASTVQNHSRNVSLRTVW